MPLPLNPGMNLIRSVCVYCGSRPGTNGGHVKAGLALGRSLAKAGLRLVYGGGTHGVMGAVAQGAREAGGRTLGIIPHFLLSKETTETGLESLDEVVITDTMHERKHRMFQESDAFVALPGGIGTLEELVEILTWAQLGRHRKPIVLANIDGFWNPLLALFEHMAAQGFVHSAHLVAPLVVEEADGIVPAILAAAAATVKPTSGDPKVIGRL